MASVEGSTAAMPSDLQPPAAAAAPKKRRRRAAASGAAEDCFTCRKRSTPCDRKRPYCSQCLGLGKECSGYPTTLTWGIGVASRGKLRGLSCPVAGKPVNQAQVEMKPEPKPRKRKSSTNSVGSNASSTSERSAPSSLPGQSAFNFASSLTPVREGQPIKIEQTHHQYAPPSLRLDIPVSLSNWQPQYGSAPLMQPTTPQTMYPTSPLSYSAGHMQQPMLFSPSRESAYSTSAQSSSTFPNPSFMTPQHEIPPTPMTFSYQDHQLPAFPYGPVDMLSQSNASQSLGNDVSSRNQQDSPELLGGSPRSNASNQESRPSQVGPLGQSQQPAANDDFGNVFMSDASELITMEEDFPQFEMTFDEVIGPHNPIDSQDLQMSSERALTLGPSIFSTRFFHLSSRMQSLLDFYDKHICSVLVAFDGNDNPYREHILSLAAHSEGLQNAIAALATNNIRMRSQKHLQSAGFVEEIKESGHEALSESRLALTAPSPEEAMYKTLSVEQLNMRLAQSGSAADDSVLATLLILCLFHVCDSGFSKFKVQLAGVQKLLALRGNASESGFIGWVQMFFTWFDVMTSTVNDRETEIKTSSLDLMNYTTDLGALEQFSGCDGRLFKLIARLGRLNLLAQQRPVKSDAGTTPAPQQKWHQPASRYRVSLDPADLLNLDGNGWSTPLSSTYDDPMASIYPDGRTEFWAEWHDIRRRLQEWSMDYSSIPGPRTPLSGGAVTSSLGPEQRDLVHINESFRSSALLYTERLANPNLPSSSPNFQQLVAQGLFHITALNVTSCVNKFLLWPLFIVGTEAVDEDHKATIRERCVEIQRESGFFNNLSVLEVLERAWRGQDGQDDSTTMRTEDGAADGQAFRWRRAMSRVDGEYIVV